MGYWYWRPIKTDWVLNENTTNRFTLPNKGYLSGLQILLNATITGHQYAADNLYPAQATDIRIVGNGNKELIDVRNRQLQAINFWETGEMPQDTLIDTDTAVLRQHLTIPFGRYMGDLKYGLILEKFKAGVEFEDSNTIDITELLDAYSKYTVYGLFRKNPEADLFAGGFFKKRQILNRDTETATQHPVTLPTLNKLKQIHMFVESDLSSNQQTVSLRNALSKIWLGLKSKQEYMIDNFDWRTWYQLIHQKYGRFPRTQITTDIHISEDNFLDTMIYDRSISTVTPGNLWTTYQRLATEYKWDREERIVRYRIHQLDGNRGGGYLYVDSLGTCYHGNVPLLMIDPKAEEDKYLDSAAEADVTVEFTELASTENVYIVLDELQKTYPDS